MADLQAPWDEEAPAEMPLLRMPLHICNSTCGPGKQAPGAAKVLDLLHVPLQTVELLEHSRQAP